jgi:S1-C subfamily serine protease
MACLFLILLFPSYTSLAEEKITSAEISAPAETQNSTDTKASPAVEINTDKEKITSAEVLLSSEIKNFTDAKVPSTVEINSTEKKMTSAEISASAETQNSADTKASPAVGIFKRYHAAVVRVIGLNDSKSDTGDSQVLEGTGFFIDDQAHVLTAASVVASPGKIWIERGDESFAAERIGSDPITNIAILRLLKRPENLTYISYQGEELAQDNLPIGSTFISIGSKLGLDPSPNQGMLTGRHLRYGDHKFVVPYRRSSLAMDGGESGSPVFDTTGHFVGVMIASLPEIRSSFILPDYAVRKITDDLLLTTAVSYVSLGFSARQELQTSGQYRISIIQVSKDSPAEKAGLQVHDELKRIDQKAISNMEDVAIAIFHLHPGDRAELEILREGQKHTLPIVADPFSSH